MKSLEYGANKNENNNVHSTNHSSLLSAHLQMRVPQLFTKALIEIINGIGETIYSKEHQVSNKKSARRLFEETSESGKVAIDQY